MDNLLLFPSENTRFSTSDVVDALSGMPGVAELRAGNLIGASVECEYWCHDRSTMVWLSSDGDTLTAQGLGDESLKFALEFQQRIAFPLRAINAGYDFDLNLRDITSVDEFRRKINL